MSFHVRPISFKPPRLSGLSARLIASHYENNYGGAVRRLNAIRGELANLDPASAPGFRLNGLKREELIATNSMILHEAYFEALGEAGGGDPTGTLAEAIARDFGSLAKWRAEFVAMGNALGGGSGWVVLTRSPRDGTLSNVWAADHTHSLAGGTPVLALDMYEHAYHIEFGANCKAYVDAFMRNVDWQAVQDRYEDALKVAPPRPLVQKEFGDLPGIDVEDVRAMLDAGKPLQLIDVRARHSVSRTPEIAVGATWRDPERVPEWMGELSKTEPVVVYCVYGFHVGCRAAIALREAGFDARYMKGGHSGWKAAGGPVKMQA
jgi:superoxide dismutase, Fe-Mn family